MVKYTAITENGVEYVKTLYENNIKYKIIVDDMDALYPAYKATLSGQGNVSSYTVSTRSLSRNNMSAGAVLSEFKTLRSQKLSIETGGRARKAYGVIPRDI